MLKSIPDFRCAGKIRHGQAETLTCFILGTLAGKKSLRRIRRWCKKRIRSLQKYMPLEQGIPSASTFSRVLAGVDEELLALTFTVWVEESIGLEGTHIAVDGKGLRGSAEKARGGKTPYILNAMDIGTQLAIGQMAIPDKTNEMAAIPEFLEILDVEGCMITIDAIGTTGRIMNTIRRLGAHFMLQVKKNNQGLYDELILLFRNLKEEREKDPEQFAENYGSNCGKWSGSEKNRERHEYREAWSCSAPEAVRDFQELRPHINSIGYMRQTRIEIVKDNDGNDITPSLKEFLEHGSRKQPVPKRSDEADSPIQEIGIISDVVLTAEQMASYKRGHWGIENSLHYVLDEVFGEDKSTFRKGKANAALLRKAAYNIVRMLLMKTGCEMPFAHAMDDIAEDWEIIAEFIFRPLPTF